MTGTYKARAGCTRAIAALDAVRKSLQRDGISFTEEVDADNTTIIRASGTAKPAWRATSARVSIMPALLTVDQCTKRQVAAQKDVQDFRENFRRVITNSAKTYGHYQRHHPSSRKGQRKVGRLVARLIARHGGREIHFTITKDDYAMLDNALGYKVKRESALPGCYTGMVEYLVKTQGHGMWKRKAERIKTNTYGPFERNDRRRQERETLDIGRYLELKADVEYWQEMVTLATGREIHRDVLRESRAA